MDRPEFYIFLIYTTYFQKDMRSACCLWWTCFLPKWCNSPHRTIVKVLLTYWRTYIVCWCMYIYSFIIFRTTSLKLCTMMWMKYSIKSEDSPAVHIYDQHAHSPMGIHLAGSLESLPSSCMPEVALLFLLGKKRELSSGVVACICLVSITDYTWGVVGQMQVDQPQVCGYAPTMPSCWKHPRKGRIPQPASDVAGWTTSVSSCWSAWAGVWNCLANTLVAISWHAPAAKWCFKWTATNWSLI